MQAPARAPRMTPVPPSSRSPASQPSPTKWTVIRPARIVTSPDGTRVERSPTPGTAQPRIREERFRPEAVAAPDKAAAVAVINF